MRALPESSRPILRSGRVVVFLCLVLIYAVFLTRTFYWDGVLFSLNIEAVAQGKLPASALFHPNHLLYSALGYVWYLACMACGIGVRAITVLQVLNVIWGALAAVVVFAIASRIVASKTIAWFCCVLFAFGATWWKFSTDADVYILAVLLLLLAVSFAIRSPPGVVPAAACHVIAMLFHELAVFAYVPLLTAILLYPQWTRAKRVTACAVYVAATGVCVFGVYLLAYASTDHRVYPTLLSWASSYASDSTFTTSWKQLAGPYLSTYIKLFGGGKLTFIREYLSIPVCAGLAASIAALVIGVVLLRRPKAVAAIYLDRRALTVLWVWLVSYGIFLTCWDAGSAFHKLFLWPAIVLLPGIYIARKPHLRERAKAFVAFALALASWNFAAFIYPHSHASADPVLGLAQAVNRQLPRNAVVYYKVLDPDDWYLEYFAPGRRWLPLPLRVDQATLRDSASGPVCFETTALSNLSGSEFRDSIEPRLKWELVNNRHNIRLECLAPRVTRPDSGHPESFLR